MQLRRSRATAQSEMGSMRIKVNTDKDYSIGETIAWGFSGGRHLYNSNHSVAE